MTLQARNEILKMLNKYLNFHLKYKIKLKVLNMDTL